MDSENHGKHEINKINNSFFRSDFYDVTAAQSVTTILNIVRRVSNNMKDQNPSSQDMVYRENTSHFQRLMTEKLR